MNNTIYYNINDKIINNSNLLYNYKGEINMSEEIIKVASLVPKGIINIFVIALICFAIYYYIVPIWYKYFIWGENLSHAFFTGGMSLLIFGIVNLIYYIFPELIWHYIIIGIIILISFIILWVVSKWLLKCRQSK